MDKRFARSRKNDFLWLEEMLTNFDVLGHLRVIGGRGGGEWFIFMLGDGGGR